MKTRRSAFKKTKRLFVVATEGAETEPIYFQEFHPGRDGGFRLRILGNPKHKSRPVEVVQRLMEYERRERPGPDTEYWAVIDRDLWPELELQEAWKIIAGVVVLLMIVVLNLWMTLRSSDRVFDDAANVPETDVALVLGTGKFTGGGHMNAHFRLRMDSAAALYKAGRVKHFVLSGDNSRDNYNEPGDMKSSLIERGVPAAALTCDYAGFRTLDSIVRAKEIFGITKCVIISDDFHLARALWIADRNGIAATAFYSKPLPWRTSGKSRAREWLARVKAVTDEIIGAEPKFGGPRITLPLAHGNEPASAP